jgi:hypothetical protein
MLLSFIISEVIRRGLILSGKLSLVFSARFNRDRDFIWEDRVATFPIQINFCLIYYPDKFYLHKTLLPEKVLINY